MQSGKHKSTRATGGAGGVDTSATASSSSKASSSKAFSNSSYHTDDRVTRDGVFGGPGAGYATEPRFDPNWKPYTIDKKEQWDSDQGRSA